VKIFPIINYIWGENFSFLTSHYIICQKWNEVHFIIEGHRVKMCSWKCQIYLCFHTYPTCAMAHPNNWGAWFIQAATNNPPFDPPLIVILKLVIEMYLLNHFFFSFRSTNVEPHLLINRHHTIIHNHANTHHTVNHKTLNKRRHKIK
jgi:hypothetical protein